MELEQRVSELERRLEALVGEHSAPDTKDTTRPARADFWALEGLKRQLVGMEAHEGGVLYAGAVRLPTGERYEWQYGALTERLLDHVGDAHEADEAECAEEGQVSAGADWADTAEALAALGHPVRLRLLREILGGRRTAAELAALDETGTTGQIYHHLRQLTGAGWLHTKGRGRYEVPGARVVPLLVVLTAAKP